MRKLPAWTALVIIAVSLVLIPVLFEVPRDTERMDSFLEALPFVVAAIALVAIPLSEAGRWRLWGGIAAGLFVLAPLWWPVAWMLVGEVGERREQATLRVVAIPGEGGAYTLAVPLPVGDRSPAFDKIPALSHMRVETRNGTEWLVIQSTHEFDYRHTVRSNRAWGGFSFAEGAKAELWHGTSPVHFMVELRAQDEHCSGTAVLVGLANPGGSGSAQSGNDGACT